MGNYNKVLENVEMLLRKYKNVIKNEKQLTLLYWKYIDKINITKDSIPTQEFLSNRTTSPQVIADAYWLIKIREETSK